MAQLLEQWVAEARNKLRSSSLAEEDLEALLQSTRSLGGKLRQRLLYLHAATPNIGSPLLAAALHEPVDGGLQQLDPGAAELPYKSVHDALRDGWQVIHFPLQMVPFDDRENDILGYEFILQKMEHYDE